MGIYLIVVIEAVSKRFDYYVDYIINFVICYGEKYTINFRGLFKRVNFQTVLNFDKIALNINFINYSRTQNSFIKRRVKTSINLPGHYYRKTTLVWNIFETR